MSRTPPKSPCYTILFPYRPLFRSRRACSDAQELDRRPLICDRSARRVVGQGAARSCAGPRTGDQRAAWGGGGRGDPCTRSRGRPSQPPRPSADDDAAERPGRAGREDPRTGPEDERGDPKSGGEGKRVAVRVDLGVGRRKTKKK